MIFFPSSAGFRGVPISFGTRFIHFLLVAPVTLNRPSEPSLKQLYHISTALSVCSPPGTLCTCTSCLEQPVLYRFTSLHCMSLPSVCAHAPFHAVPSSQGRRPAQSSLVYLSSILLHLRGHSFMSSTYPSSTQRAYGHSARSSSSNAVSSITVSLDFRCPSGYPSHIHPFASCRNQHTHHLHTVHSIKPRSALQKRQHITAERTSLQLLDPVPLLASSVFVLSSSLFLFLGISASGKGETEVKIIAVYYCSYCIFTVFRREVEKKEKFCRIHYSLLMIISALLMCGLDREGSSSAPFATSWSNRETREGEAIPRRARHRQRQFQTSKAPAATNKDK